MTATQLRPSELSPADVDHVRKVVREHSAIVLDAGKAYLIESRLAPIARQHGFVSVRELIATLRRSPVGPLADVVVDAMTTNETTFFRDVSLWTALEHHWLPDLIERRRTTRHLNIWHAACSSGQEPYSMAMLLVDRFPQLRDWNVRIIATDLSAEMLGRATAGRFTQLEVNRGLPTPLLVRHFHRDGAFWQVNDQLRSMVEFRMLNLVGTWGFLPRIDLLFLRNVLIYFDLDVKRRILGRAREVLQPDGYLLLGTAETTLNIDDRYERLVADTATAYRPR